MSQEFALDLKQSTLERPVVQTLTPFVATLVERGLFVPCTKDGIRFDRISQAVVAPASSKEAVDTLTIPVDQMSVAITKSMNINQLREYAVQNLGKSFPSNLTRAKLMKAVNEAIREKQAELDAADEDDEDDEDSDEDEDDDAS